MDPGSPTQELARLIGRQAVREGRSPTAIDGLEVFRADRPTPLRCNVYTPCVIVVAQGRKHAHLGGQVYEYSPSSYLVLPLTLPVDSRVLEASPEQPFLSMAIRIEPAALGQIMLDAGFDTPTATEPARGIAVSAVDPDLLQAAVRLVACLDSEMDARILGPQIQRELLYRVLTGPQGPLLQAAGLRDGRFNQVARALSLIHESFSRPWQVSELAREAHMSASSFYEAFRAVTSLSPLQYLKEIRLHRARQIMVWEGVSAKRAARSVGYSSDSQFSREFKRRFGRPPGQERQWAIQTGELAQARPY